MAVITEGLVLAGAAAAESRRLDTRNNAPGAADDLKITADFQKCVDLRIYGKRAVAYCERASTARFWLTARFEADVMV